MRIIYSLFLIFSFFVIFTSCENNPCEGVECQNGGICVEGDCDCPENFFGPECEFQLDPCTIKQCMAPNTEECLVSNTGEATCRCKDGFRGDRCEELWTDPYPGVFTAQEDCDGKVSTFPMEVETGPDFNQITLGNFHDQESSIDLSKIVGNLITARVFDIYTQFMIFGQVDGAGNLNSDQTISLGYTIIEGGDTLNCTALLRR